ncbi:hypothetical protein F5883DRAFT_580595 [Diaporthe sp. PMI_573]|nr:hypothetical protein F5883DRAFT_580595 [Diaporthaceae sp. PMI_573]
MLSSSGQARSERFSRDRQGPISCTSIVTKMDPFNLSEPQVRDYYADLGLPQQASSREIKAAFRRLAKKHHPDKKAPGKSIDAQDFCKATYECLIDDAKRSEYDARYFNLQDQWTRYRERQEKEKRAAREKAERESAREERARQAEERSREAGRKAREQQEQAAKERLQREKEREAEKRSEEAAKRIRVEQERIRWKRFLDEVMEFGPYDIDGMKRSGRPQFKKP